MSIYQSADIYLHFSFGHITVCEILASQPGTGQVHTPCIGRQSLSYWITREAPPVSFTKNI